MQGDDGPVGVVEVVVVVRHGAGHADAGDGEVAVTAGVGRCGGCTG